MIAAVAEKVLTTDGRFLDGAIIQDGPPPASGVGVFSCPRESMARRKRRPGNLPGASRKSHRREPPRTSDLIREKRACAITGEPPQLAELDRCIYAAWAYGDTNTFNELEAKRSEIERGHQKLVGEISSTPLGMCLARKLITREQYQAGILYEANAKRLGHMVRGPGETKSMLANFLAESAPSVYRGIEDAEWDKRVWDHCRWVEREITARVRDWRQIDSVLVKGEMPVFMDYAPDAQSITLANFRHDLTEIAKFFEKPPRREELRGRPPVRRRAIPNKVAAA